MTLSILLIIFAIIVAGIFLYALMTLFHVMRFGHMDASTYFITGIFVAGFAFTLFVSYSFIRKIDWQAPLFTIGHNTFTNSNINTGF